MSDVSVAFGQLNPSGSPERLEQLENMFLVLVAFGKLNPSGSPERLEQLLNIDEKFETGPKSTEHSLRLALPDCHPFKSCWFVKVFGLSKSLKSEKTFPPML